MRALRTEIARWWRRVDDPRPLPVDPTTGYLLEDHDGERLDALHDVPCLILLGEPGLGKTTDVQAAKRALGEGSWVRWLNAIRDASEVDRFFAEPVERARSGRVAHLFLDGLDESVASLAGLSERIADALGALDTLRHLRLRVVSRSAALPEALPRLLAGVYGRDDVRTYTLLPLRESDVQSILDGEPAHRRDLVRELLRESGAEPTAKNSIAPLTARPITLSLLVAQAQTLRGTTTSWEVFDAAMPALVTTTPTDDVPRARVLAASIAVASLLGGRPRIAARPERSMAVEGLLALDELDAVAPASELASMVRNAPVFAAAHDDDALDACVFAHRTYAEHLAAELLARCNDTEAVIDRLFLPGVEGSRVVPQLRGVAAQLAARGRFFRPLLKRDPLTLIDVDPKLLDDTQRSQFVDAVLSQGDMLRTLGWANDLGRRLAQFTHEKFVAQLIHWITDDAAFEYTRQIAISTARHTRLEGLVEALATLALNPKEPVGLRARAVNAMRRMYAGAGPSSLRPLLDAQHLSRLDPGDDLRGELLTTLWPDWLEPEALFRALTPPKAPQRFGTYASFVSIILPKAITPAALAPALRWCGDHIDRQTFWPPDELVNAVLGLALQHLDDKGVSDALYAYVARLVDDPTATIAELATALTNTPEPLREMRRWALLELLLPLCRSDAQGATLLFSLYALLPTNTSLLLDRAERAADPLDARTWVELATQQLQRRADWDAPTVERLLQIRDAPGGSPASQCLAWLRECPLDGDAARWAREDAQRRHRAERQRKASTEKLSRTLEDLIALAAGGDLDAFWQTTYWMHARVRSGGGFEHRQRAPISRSEVWLRMPPADQRALLVTAADYLHRWPIDVGPWFTEHRIPWSVIAGRQAIVLLAECAPASLDTLPAAVWARWIPAFLAPSWVAEECSAHLFASLLRRAYRADPTTFRQRALQLLASRPGGDATVVGDFVAVLDEDFAGALSSFALLHDVSVDTLREVLRALAPEHLATARQIASTVIAHDWKGEADAQRRATCAGAWWLEAEPDLAWSTLHPKVERDRMLGADIVHAVDSHGRTHWGPRFETAAALGSFYAWCRDTVDLLPAREESDELTARLTARTTLQWMIPAARQRLSALGTQEALDEIARLLDARPDDQNLALALHDAREQMVERRWRGWPVRELLATFCALPTPAPP